VPNELKPVNQILRLLPLLSDKDLQQVKKEIDKIILKRGFERSADKKEIPGYRGKK
jgi:hypothetical protein